MAPSKRSKASGSFCSLAGAKFSRSSCGWSTSVAAVDRLSVKGAEMVEHAPLGHRRANKVSGVMPRDSALHGRDRGRWGCRDNTAGTRSPLALGSLGNGDTPFAMASRRSSSAGDARSSGNCSSAERGRSDRDAERMLSPPRCGRWRSISVTKRTALARRTGRDAR